MHVAPFFVLLLRHAIDLLCLVALCVPAPQNLSPMVVRVYSVDNSWVDVPVSAWTTPAQVREMAAAMHGIGKKNRRCFQYAHHHHCCLLLSIWGWRPHSPVAVCCSGSTMCKRMALSVCCLTRRGV